MWRIVQIAADENSLKENPGEFGVAAFSSQSSGVARRKSQVRMKVDNSRRARS